MLPTRPAPEEWATAEATEAEATEAEAEATEAEAEATQAEAATEAEVTEAVGSVAMHGGTAAATTPTAFALDASTLRQREMVVGLWRLEYGLFDFLSVGTTRSSADVSTTQRSLLTTLALTPALFARPSRGLERALGRVGVPSHLSALIGWLGWLPEVLDDAHEALRASVAVQSGIDGLPEGLAQHTELDVAAMVTRFFPFDRTLIERVADRIDWNRLSVLVQRERDFGWRL